MVASDDPTEKASGRGLGILRDEGVDVQVVDGDVSHSARLLNQPFRKHARTGRPLVIFKSAMSLDGKVATQTGDSKWISGEESRSLVHRWRARGRRDLHRHRHGARRRPAADGPRARTRSRQPARVVFDSEARLPLGEPAGAHGARGAADRGRRRARPTARALEALQAAGVEVVVAAGGTEAERVIDALDKLGALGIQSMLLEGGPRLAGSFLDAGEVDEMRIFIAPIALGGRGARDVARGRGVGLDRATPGTRARCDVEDDRRGRAASRRGSRSGERQPRGSQWQTRCSPG